MTILDEILNIKESAANFLMKVAECYGSPDNDENVELELKKETMIHTFDGMSNVVKLVSRYHYDDGTDNAYPELQIVTDEQTFGLEYVKYTYIQLPIEGMIELCLSVSEQFGFGDMFNELFAQAMVDDEV